MSYRVLVTRASHQASDLAERLRALGAEPVSLPTLAIAEPSSFAVLDAALAELRTFNWVIVTSANAAESFARRAAMLCRALEGRVLLANLRVAAIGPATARALQAQGVVRSLDSVLLPQQAVAESLLDTLLQHVRTRRGTATRFLLVRAEEARDVLPDGLRAAGAEVTIAPAYRNIVPWASIEALRKLFTSPEHLPDAITFTSSSSVRNLLALCEAAGEVLPGTIQRISIGPITTQTLCEVNLPPHAQAPEANISSLAETAIRSLAHRR